MNERLADGDRRDDNMPAPSSPSPSRQVDLEASLLAAQLKELDTRPNDHSASSRAWILMVISADAETRYYVRECLRARDNIRVVEVASSENAALIARHVHPDLIIADIEGEELAVSPVITLADDQPRADRELPSQQHRKRAWLTRPFNADALIALVDQMLGSRPP